jgi:hypothetical protein
MSMNYFSMRYFPMYFCFLCNDTLSSSSDHGDKFDIFEFGSGFKSQIRMIISGKKLLMSLNVSNDFKIKFY